MMLELQRTCKSLDYESLGEFEVLVFWISGFIELHLCISISLHSCMCPSLSFVSGRCHCRLFLLCEKYPASSSAQTAFYCCTECRVRLLDCVVNQVSL
jgi:hypothetical protein